MQVKILVIFATLAVAAVADNNLCPYPSKAVRLVLERILIVPSPVNGRHVERIELPKEVLQGKDPSCISIISGRYGSTPDYVSLGKNPHGDYSVDIHSRLRNPLNVTLYMYTD